MRYFLSLLLLTAMPVFFVGCNGTGSCVYKDGVDYAKLSTYAVEPFPQSTLDAAPLFAAHAGAVYDAIDKAMAAKNFRRAAEGETPDFVLRPSFTQATLENPDVVLTLDINAQAYIPTLISEGRLAIDAEYKGLVVFRGWSPWGAAMNSFDDSDAERMVQWCLAKFPPPYKEPKMPQIKALPQES